MIKDFNIVPSKRNQPSVNNDGTKIPEVLDSRIGDAICDNFDKIIVGDCMHKIDLGRYNLRTDLIIEKIKDNTNVLKYHKETKIIQIR